MGQAKALLDHEGQTFLARVVSALSNGGCEHVVVVTSGDDRIGTEATAAGAEVLVNPDPGEGPITSLRLALENVAPSTDGIAYLPLDFPLVTGDCVSRLLDAAQTSDAPVTLPLFGDKRGHPALFRRLLFGELLDPGLVGGGRTVVHRHLTDACLLPFDHPGVVTDVDTPQAYQALSSGA